MHCRGTSSLSHFLRNLSIEAQTHCTTQPGPSKVSSNKKSCKSHTWGKRRCWDLLKLPAGWAVCTYPRGWQNSAVPLPIIPQHLAPSGLQFQPFILEFYLFFPLFFLWKGRVLFQVLHQSKPGAAPDLNWVHKKLFLLSFALGRENQSQLGAELGAALWSQNLSYFPELWPQLRAFALKARQKKESQHLPQPNGHCHGGQEKQKSQITSGTGRKQQTINTTDKKSSRGLEASSFKGRGV